MFSALENTWDQSARRGWTTAVSFAMQALGVSLLLAIPLLTVQGPPQWMRMTSSFFAPPAGRSAPAPPSAQHPIRSSNMSGVHLMQPPTVPTSIAQVNDANVPAAPDIDGGGIDGGTGLRGSAVPGGIGDATALAPTPSPVAPNHPVRLSHWSEGNLVYRVQPSYPALARQARIQGPVELRAIISKNGTIENLSVLSGHAMLVAAAIEAVKKWRYRPYLLNGEPVEVETEITVNFILSGG